MIEFGVSVYQNLWNELLPTTATALADNFQGGAQSCLYYQYFFSEYINMFQTLKKIINNINSSMHNSSTEILKDMNQGSEAVWQSHPP